MPKIKETVSKEQIKHAEGWEVITILSNQEYSLVVAVSLAAVVPLSLRRSRLVFPLVLLFSTRTYHVRRSKTSPDILLETNQRWSDALVDWWCCHRSHEWIERVSCGLTSSWHVAHRIGCRWRYRTVWRWNQRDPRENEHWRKQSRHSDVRSRHALTCPSPVVHWMFCPNERVAWNKYSWRDAYSTRSTSVGYVRDISVEMRGSFPVLHHVRCLTIVVDNRWIEELIDQLEGGCAFIA